MSSGGNTISGSMGNPIDPNASRTESFADLIKAEGQFLVSKSQADLNEAQADLTEAQANREQIGNEELQLRVDRMQRQQELLDAAQRKAANDLKTVNVHIQRLSQLESEGRTNRYIFYSITQLLIILNEPGVTLSVMGRTVPDSAFDTPDFALNSDAKSGATIPPFTGNNLGQLLAFAQKYTLMFVPFSPTHIYILGALAELSAAAAKKAADISADEKANRDQPIAPLPAPGGNATGSASATELKKP